MLANQVASGVAATALHPVTVQVFNNGPGIWGSVATGFITGCIAIAGVALTHHFTLRREKIASEDKRKKELHYLATELAFKLELYASAFISLPRQLLIDMNAGRKPLPELDLSSAAGDWRSLPVGLIFRLRSLETIHAALMSSLTNAKHPDHPTVFWPLQLRGYNVGLNAFILAARLRRLAELPDADDLKRKDGTFQKLRELRKEKWRQHVSDLKKSKQPLMTI